MKFAMMVLSLLFGASVEAAPTEKLQAKLPQSSSFPSLQTAGKLSAPIPPLRFVVGKYALIKSVLTRGRDGTWVNNESVVCDGVTSIPVVDLDPNGGEFSADLIECATTTNGDAVLASIVSGVLLNTKAHLFPSEGPFKVRDNFVMLTLKSAQGTSTTGVPYGISFSASRDANASAINSLTPDSSGNCGAAPMPTCGNPTIESFRLNMEFGS